MIESLSGIKMLSAATVFGTAAVVFTSVPFMFIIIRGIMRAKDRSTGGGNFLGVVLLAYFVHGVSTLAFITTMHILDIFSRTKGTKYFSDKLFRIFWAKDQSSAFSIANITSDSNEALGAYATLFTIRTAADLLYTALPVVVILGAAAYGIGLATKDTYRQDYLTIIIYAGVSMISAMLLYIMWVNIASIGLFLPDTDLITTIKGNWKKMLGIS